MVTMARGAFIMQCSSSNLSDFLPALQSPLTNPSHIHTQDGDGDDDDDDDRVIKLIIGEARLILINSLAKVEPWPWI